MKDGVGLLPSFSPLTITDYSILIILVGRSGYSTKNVLQEHEEWHAYFIRTMVQFHVLGEMFHSPAAHGGRLLPVGWMYWLKCM